MEIKFIAQDRETELLVEPPVPAKNALPAWYKDEPRFLYGNRPIFNNGKVSNNSFKACAPFYDSLTAGYIQKTWCDIHLSFKYDGNKLSGFEYNFASYPKIMSHREKVSIKNLNDFHPIEFVWQIPWTPILPSGWSALFVHPINRFDLPFSSLSGIIDSDKFYHSLGGSYPFFIKKEFNERIIPAGTPMYQIIPFKREKWKSKSAQVTDEYRKKISQKHLRYFIGSYKKFFHQKKYFE